MNSDSRYRRPAGRAGFTLLEVLLATAIGAILMAALYTAIKLQLGRAKAAREVVEQGNLVRALMGKVGNDINMNLGPANIIANASSGVGNSSSSSQQGTSGNTGGTNNTGSTGATGNTGNTGNTGTGGSSSSNNNNNSNQQSGTPGYQVPFNLGVQGDATHLNLYASRVPREAFQVFDATQDPTTPSGFSDLRRISYWLADGGGLARQEFLAVTSDDEMNVVPPNIPNEGNYVIAEEVKSVAFSYFDGQSWQDSWDGTEIGVDGQTPIGPPVAIAITLGMVLPGTQDVRNYRHVVFIPAANGIGMTPAQAGTSPTSGM